MHADLIDAPRHWREPTMVFVNSMSDLLHGKVPISFVRDIFATMAATPQHTYQVLTKRASRLPRIVDKLDWPTNLWMGVSVENEAVRDRIDSLRAIPTTVRFVSAEPLIGPLPNLDLDGIDWVIVGGESGPGHRPMSLSWAEDIQAQCEASETAYFFKQTGASLARTLGLPGKGDRPDQWPTLWPQEFPVGVARSA